MVPSYGTPERRELDKAMLEGTLGWPHRDVLPVKNPTRYNIDNDHAFGVVRAGAPTSVALRNLFDEGEAEVETYPDLDALLDAGWTVD